MKENFKKLKKWIVGIITTVCATALTSIITSAIKNISFLASLKWIMSQVVNFFINFFTFQIPVYIIILSLALLVFIVYIINNILNTKDNTPPFLNYRKDEFKKWHVKWAYDKYAGEYIINDLRPVCRCGCELIPSNQYTFESALRCPNCERKYPKFKEEDRLEITVLISHKINTEKFD